VRHLLPVSMTGTAYEWQGCSRWNRRAESAAIGLQLCCRSNFEMLGALACGVATGAPVVR